MQIYGEINLLFDSCSRTVIEEFRNDIRLTKEKLATRLFLPRGVLQDYRLKDDARRVELLRLVDINLLLGEFEK